MILSNLSSSYAFFTLEFSNFFGIFTTKKLLYIDIVILHIIRIFMMIPFDIKYIWEVINILFTM